MTDSFYTKRYDSIQALRGIAALSVVLHHISFIENGAFGVDIFFCISGFIMMYVTHISSKQFFLKRIIRIVPLYTCVTLITFGAMLVFPYLFEESTPDIIILIKSLFFIPCRISGAIQPIVRVGWTLNYEVFFYVILWLSMKISIKYRGLIASGILATLAIFGKIISFHGTILPFYTNSILIEFIFGIIAYELLKGFNYNRLLKRMIMLRVCLLLIAAACYVFMFMVKYSDVFQDHDRVIILGIPALILFICTFVALYDVKIPGVFVFLGDISYSVYLVHYFIARYYDRILMQYGYESILPRCAAVFVFVSAIAIGSASYYLFEVKLNNRLRRWLVHGR